MRITLDFETASLTDLKESGAWRYAECPTTEILTLCYSDGRLMRRWKPGMDTKHLRDLAAGTAIFEAHNVSFEKAIWRNIMVETFALPDVPDYRWRDALAVCAYKSIPQSLDEAVAWLRLPQAKDKEGSKITIGLSKPRKDGTFDRSLATLQRVDEYCASDVEIEIALSHRIGELPEAEMAIWLMDQAINQRGIKLDMALVSAARDVVAQATVPLVEEFRQITGLNPTQGAKILAWLHERNVHLDDLTKETVAKSLGANEDAILHFGEDVLDDGAGSKATPMPAECHRALTIRSLINSASIKKLKRMQACVCSDGRARGSLQYHGTGPGRWAGRLFQPQNFPRGTIKMKPEAAVEAIMTRDAQFVQSWFGNPIEVVASSLRHIITAEKGKVLMASDYAGIQARVVLALAGQHDKTKLMEGGVDVYCDMAQSIYKRPIDKHKDQEERHVGKGAVLGLGFGMGAKKFNLQFAPNLSPEFCKTVVQVYRKEWAPCVPRLWQGLGSAAIQTVHQRRPHEAYGVEYRLEDGWLSARLPSGRKIWYWNPQPTREAMPWDEDDIRPSFTYQAKKTGQVRTIKAFGGLLTENVVMGIERDIIAQGMLNCEREGFPIVFTVHDEVVAEVEEAKADKNHFMQCLLDIPAWAKALRIPVAVPADDTWIATRYRK